MRSFAAGEAQGVSQGEFVVTAELSDCLQALSTG